MRINSIIPLRFLASFLLIIPLSLSTAPLCSDSPVASLAIPPNGYENVSSDHVGLVASPTLSSILGIRGTSAILSLMQSETTMASYLSSYSAPIALATLAIIVLVFGWPILVCGVFFRACRRCCCEPRDPISPSRRFWVVIGFLVSFLSLGLIVASSLLVKYSGSISDVLAGSSCAIQSLSFYFSNGFSASSFRNDTFSGLSTISTNLTLLELAISTSNITSMSANYTSSLEVVTKAAILNSHMTHFYNMMLINGYSRKRNHRCRVCETIAGYNSTFPTDIKYTSQNHPPPSSII